MSCHVMRCDAMQWNVYIDAYMVAEVIASPRFKMAKLTHLFWETFMTHCHIILQISADGKVDYWAVATSPSSTVEASPKAAPCNTAKWYPLVMTNIAMENHYFLWENPLFLWPFSIAMLNYQRVDSSKIGCVYKDFQNLPKKHLGFWTPLNLFTSPGVKWQATWSRVASLMDLHAGGPLKAGLVLLAEGHSGTG